MAGTNTAWYDKKPFRKIIDNVLFHGLQLVLRLDTRKRDVENIELDKINKILFIATAGIGDTLFATPAIRSLKERFPQAQIWLLLNETYFDFFKNNPYIDKAFCVPSNGYRKFLWSIKTIREQDFDVAIVSHAHDYAGTCRPYLAGIKFIIGGMWFRTKFWFLLSNRRNHPDYDRNLYTLLDFQRHLIDFLDCHPKEFKMGVYLQQEACDKAKKILGNNGVANDDIIVGFQPKTQAFCKDWPAGNYIELGKRLLEYNPRIKILLLGAPQDKQTADVIEKGIASDRVCNLAGKTTLVESVAIINKLNLLIAGVTGMLHVATALETKTIALLGGMEDPGKLGTINDSNKDIIRIIKKPATCTPCNMRVCVQPAKCMDLITVDEILEKIKQCSILS